MLLEVLATAADWTWLLTGLVGLLTLFIVKHILTVRSLPPGPFPLPILGNLLAFRGKGNSVKTVLNKWTEQYKGIFCVWLGPSPTVVVTNWELNREALIVKRNDFSGRVLRNTFKQFVGDHNDVIFSDFGPTWEILRKILHSAVRKYAVSEKLSDLTSVVVDMAIEDMMKQKGKSVDAKNYMYLIISNVLASSSFGRRFQMEDPEFINLRDLNSEMTEAIGTGLPSDALPALSIFYRKEEKRIRDLFAGIKSYIAVQYYEHKRTYKKGVIRDFTDAILDAREEAKEEGSDNLEHLTDGNQVLLLADLFLAGTDTTKVTLMWLMLLICKYPEVQEKMAREIQENLGGRAPVQQDRFSCHYTYATIYETLRFRPVIDTTLEHKTICDTEIGGYKIPKDTSCLFHILNVHSDESNFKNPEQFQPERFLEPDGRFTNARLTGYMPFSLGRRACPGEKLALADIFLIITRLLQRCSFELEGGSENANLVADQETISSNPASYNLNVKMREYKV